MADKNPFEGLDAKPEDFHKEPNPFEGLDLNPKSPEYKHEGGKMRTFRDFASIGTGLLRAGQSFLGTPGDVEGYLNIPPPKGIVHWPTTQQVGEGAGKAAQAIGLSPDLAKSETPEGKFFEAAAQAAGAMASKKPWVVGAGAGSGVTGELASRFLDSGETPEGQKSWARTGGELAIQGPLLALNLMKPGAVKALQPGLNRLGDQGQQLAKLDRAGVLADLAAQRTGMTHVSPWSQLP